jgi:superfamily II DNA or RNA helicase
MVATEHHPTVGALVRVRGRDWVVLPSGDPDVVHLRPLTGAEEDTIGVFLPLEGKDLRASSFAPPDPQHAGDTTGATLLLDAARLSLRSGATPFRSLGRFSFTPRPYQFVPLMLALRHKHVRLLLADDVGTGKTIEAAIVARELLDRGIARRLAVISPAHLCEQWQAELREKFGIDAAIIQPARIASLERDLPRQDISIYQYYRHFVLSIDFIKSERNRGPFLQNAPDLVIVDEAHTAARPRGDADQVRHQRYEFLRLLASDPARHLLLVTATPHSGIEESFRSLLGLLDTRFDTYAELDRASLVPYIVQRRRRDLAHWLGSETPFPDRDSDERTYMLSADYHALFDDVLAYCRESVSKAPQARRQQQRVRHWAALALLRCVLSSPAAAVAVLSTRANRDIPAPLGDETAESERDVDELYRPQVLDPVEGDALGDYAPTAPIEDAEPLLSDSERRRLNSFLRRAQSLAGPDRDAKLAELSRVLHELLRQGRQPIVFCRFIASARYLEDWLRRLLVREFPDISVVAVTGEIGDDERRARVEDLASESARVLVATDCLSEGVNLQESFDAVIHYDLPWNPNRLEQREGRVDRFGQPKPTVHATLLYGRDNPVDLVVLDVLVRKARTIRRQLGVSVPVPVDSERVLETLVDNVLLRGESAGVQLGFAFETPDVSRLHQAWDLAAQREERQRSYFAQRGIQPDEVARELEASDPVLGDAGAVERFLNNAVQRFHGVLSTTRKPGVMELQSGELRPRLAARGFDAVPLIITFDRTTNATAEYVGRTHPIVAEFSDAVLGSALAPEPDPRFARGGAMFTDSVRLRTAILLLRVRYLLREEAAPEQYAEEIILGAFERRDGQVAWLKPLGTAARDLLARAEPVANMPQSERIQHVRWALDLLDANADWFALLVGDRVHELQASHARVRKMLRTPRLDIEPRTPPDILGCYALVPAGGGR